MTGRAAFGALDELSCYLDSPAEPNNVHLEAWLSGRLDASRLRRAVGSALRELPAARRRRMPSGRWQRAYLWEVRDAADVDPVTVASWTTESDLAAVRAGFLARAPSLDQAPVFRLLLASGPDRDCLIMNAHHAAFDGRSCELLLRHIAAAYSGAGSSGGGAHGGAHDGGAARLAEPAARESAARDDLGLPARGRGRPARVAAAAASRRAPGYGYVLLPWPGIPAPAAGQRATVNDLLVAALIATIAGWNADHGRRPGPVRISMPADARPPGHASDLGNMSRVHPVTATAGPGLLARVAAQTSAARRLGALPAADGQPGNSEPSALPAADGQPGTREPGALPAADGQPGTREPGTRQPGTRQPGAQARLTRLRLPTAVKRRTYRAAVHMLGAVYSDTSLLTNLGNITDPPVFDGLAPDRMWFSTSAHMPRGLSVGAISTGGLLNVCFRHRYALLDDAAARMFAARYADALTQLSRTPPPPAT